MKAIALLTLLALSSSTEARVGETLDECSYRYGASIGHYSHDQVRFNRGHIYITVHVRNNHSIREDFGPEAGGTLSDAQIGDSKRQRERPSMGKSRRVRECG